MSSVEEIQSKARHQLVTLAQERALLRDDRDALQALVTMIARAVWMAVQAELTPDEMRKAWREGTTQGGQPLETQPIFDPTLELDYWLNVHADAEAFWESRSGYGDDETFAD